MFSPNEIKLLRKIAAKVVGNPDLDAALASYPAEISECWIWTGAGASTPIIRIGKTSTTVVRALVEIACREKVTDAWIAVRKVGCTSKRCINPTHFELKAHNQNRYGMEGLLPSKLGGSTGDQVQDVLDLLEEWEEPTREEFEARCAALHLKFPEADIDAAYAQLGC